MVCLSEMRDCFAQMRASKQKRAVSKPLFFMSATPARTWFYRICKNPRTSLFLCPFLATLNLNLLLTQSFYGE